MGRRTVEEEAAVRKAILEHLNENGDNEPLRTIARKVYERIGLNPSIATVSNVIREWRKGGG